MTICILVLLLTGWVPHPLYAAEIRTFQDIALPTPPPPVVPSGANRSSELASRQLEVSGTNTVSMDSGRELKQTGALSHFSSANFGNELQLNLTFSATPSSDQSWEGDSSARFAHGDPDSLLTSDTKTTAELQQLHIAWNEANTAVPLRAELGDINGYLTSRTLQRQIKGIQLELQPPLPGQVKSSLLFMTGNPVYAWSDWAQSNDRITAGSYLMSHPQWGTWTLNTVHSEYAPFAFSSAFRNEQVYSIGGFNTFDFAGQQMTLEPEIARYSAVDPAAVPAPGVAGAAAPDSPTSKQGDGLFAALTGTPLALPRLSYGLDYSIYDQEFQPHGAWVTPGRRRAKSSLAWQFANGPTVTARVVRSVDGWESDTPKETRTRGLRINGSPFFQSLKQWMGNVDLYRQDVMSETGALQQHADTLSLSLFQTGHPNWQASTILFVRNGKSFFTPTPATNHLEQATLSVTYSKNAHSFTGKLSWSRQSNAYGAFTNKSVGKELTLGYETTRGSDTLSLQFKGDLSRSTWSDPSGSLEVMLSWERSFGS